MSEKPEVEMLEAFEGLIEIELKITRESSSMLLLDKYMDLYQTKLRKPDLEYDCPETDEITNGKGHNGTSPCRGTNKISSKSADEKSIFSRLWSQNPDEMIDPTQPNLSDSEGAPFKEGQSSEFFDAKEYIATKINQILARTGGDNIKVPNYIVFSRRDNHCGFEGKIFISNICQEYVTYRVASSNAQKFRYFPDDIGWIPPNSRREIFVQTNRQEAKNFEDIISEVFQIQATKICHKEQLKMHCLDIFWTALGTEMFPEELCEKHLIKYVRPKENSYLDNFSMLDRLKFRFFKTIKDIDLPPSSCSERLFYENWPVPNYAVNNEQKQRAEVLMGCVEEIEKTEDSIRTKMSYTYTCTIFTISAFISVYALGFALYGDPSAALAEIKCAFQKCMAR